MTHASGSGSGGVAGRKVGRYVLQDRLGSGAMGAVFRAWDPTIRRHVAIKMILPRPGVEREDLDRFVREAQAAGRLRHPNVVAIHDVGHHGEDPFIVMELVEGETLHAILRRQPPVGPVLALLRQVADALHHAHGQGIIHRDVKPANVLIDRDRRPMLTDFGLADDSSARDRLTATGTTIGTPLYMSPEQVAGRREEIGPPADVWSIGATLYETIVGRPPFTSPAIVDIFAKILTDDPTPPRQLNPAVPVEVAALAMRCLDKDARPRPGAAELAAELGRLAPLVAPELRVAIAPEGAATAGASAAATELEPAASAAATELGSRPRRGSGRSTKRPSTRRSSRGSARGSARSATAKADASRGGAVRPASSWAPLAALAVVVAAVGAGVTGVVLLAGDGPAQPDPAPSPAADPTPGSEVSSIEPPDDPVDPDDDSPPLIVLDAPTPGDTVDPDHVLVRGRIDEAHLAAFEIDGLAVAVAGDGSFEHELQLGPGATAMVDVVAVDASGLEARTGVPVQLARRVGGQLEVELAYLPDGPSERMMLRGDFSRWEDAPPHPLIDDGRGRLTRRHRFPPGEHQYKFHRGDRWRTDPENPFVRLGEHRNSVLYLDRPPPPASIVERPRAAPHPPELASLPGADALARWLTTTRQPFHTAETVSFVIERPRATRAWLLLDDAERRRHRWALRRLSPDQDAFAVTLERRDLRGRAVYRFEVEDADGTRRRVDDPHAASFDIEGGVIGAAVSPPDAKRAGRILVERRVADPNDAVASRDLLIWLPPGYDEDDRRHPVLYVPNGAIAFADHDGSRFGKGSVHLHETAAGLIGREEIEAFVIVAIVGNAELGEAELHGPLSPAYLDYLEAVKARVDGALRTRPDRESTAILGTGFGASLAISAVLDRTATWGRAAGLSPKFGPADRPAEPMCPQASLAARLPEPLDARLWIDIGTGRYEARLDHREVQRLATLAPRISADMSVRFIEGAEHDEAAWRARTEEVLRFIFRPDR